MNGNIYITGFMGAGKSTIGGRLAKVLRRRFVEMDDLIVRRLDMPIPQIFSKMGEEGFRSAETAELEKTAKKERLVVATGGGLPVKQENRAIMRKSGRILNLQADLEVCLGRLGESARPDRPNWREPKELARLFDARRAAYEDCDLGVSVEDQTPDGVVQKCGELLFPEERHTVDLGGALHPLAITWQGPESLLPHTQARRAVLLTDKNVGKAHLERYRGLLNDPLVLTINPGDGRKTLNTARRLYQALLDARMERGDILVAVGGGMITDLGAFVASTYKRGMSVALVSTSLLGCVDAAVGGKSGVNLGPAKNVVGCFCVPQAVVLDLQALSTLPRRQISEGLVEAYKTGLVLEPELAVLIEENLKPFLAGDLFYLAEAAKRSALCKTKVVKEDFKETGLRRILNLGHTYGHALEGVNRYHISHGRAVAAGIMVAAAISSKRGMIPERLYERIAKTMRPLAPAPSAWPTAEQAWEIMRNDKKNQGGRVMFILLERLGKAVWVDDVTTPELEAALASVLGE